MPHLLTHGKAAESGRVQIGTVAGFVSEWWPGSNRNGGRHHLGMAAGFRLECLAGLRRNLQFQNIAKRAHLIGDDGVPKSIHVEKWNRHEWLAACASSASSARPIDKCASHFVLLLVALATGRLSRHCRTPYKKGAKCDGDCDGQSYQT
jgi:hypothetical protein